MLLLIRVFIDVYLRWHLAGKLPESAFPAFGHSQRSRRTKWRSRPDSGAPTSCIAPPVLRDPRSMATNPMLLINSITSCLASVSSPDVKITVRGLFGEKSSIQSIGMLPNSRILVLPGQQHIAMDTAPDLFVREVLAFLAKPAR